jgi:hypothetical protein
MPTVWLRHNALQARYTCSRVTIDRLVDEGQLPPKSFPLNKAPLWPLELLDAWDDLDQDGDERKLILSAWPNWKDALAQIERERADAASTPKPKRRKSKHRQQEATA